MPTDQAIQAQLRHESSLLLKANVVGVAVGHKNETGDPAVVVLVEEKMPLTALAVEDVIPPELEGMRTDVVEVGYLRALQTPQDRFRPVPGGVSIGHFKVTAGTLGVMVKDTTTGERYILSNNHVLANSNEASIGDPIVQPGVLDGGSVPADVVAELYKFIPLAFIGDPVVTPPPPPPDPGPQPPPPPPLPDPTPTPDPAGCDVVGLFVTIGNVLAEILGSNRRVEARSVNVQAQAAGGGGAPAFPEPVLMAQELLQQISVPENRLDAALARPINGVTFLNEILHIGTITGTKPPSLGMRVRKHGRTTGYTEGTITLLNATVNIAYGTSTGSKTARFTGQVITEAMSQGGDSGSLIVDATENRAVGLLFAGSSLATIFTPIDVVLNTLNVTF